MNTAGLIFFLVTAVLLIVAGVHAETKSGEKKNIIKNDYLNESL